MELTRRLFVVMIVWLILFNANMILNFMQSPFNTGNIIWLWHHVFIYCTDQKGNLTDFLSVWNGNFPSHPNQVPSVFCFFCSAQVEQVSSDTLFLLLLTILQIKAVYLCISLTCSLYFVQRRTLGLFVVNLMGVPVVIFKTTACCSLNLHMLVC